MKVCREQHPIHRLVSLNNGNYKKKKIIMGDFSYIRTAEAAVERLFSYL